MRTQLELFPSYTDVYYWNKEANTKIVVNQGGTSSSKTYSIIQLLVHKAIETANTRITVVADTAGSLERGALRDFKNQINTSKLLYTLLKDPELKTGPFVFYNNSFIEFVNLKDSSKAKHGKRDYTLLNEANHIDYDSAKAIMVRTAKQTFIDFNPDAEFWVHTEYGDNPTATWIISNFTHNQFCPQNTIDYLYEAKANFEGSGDQMLRAKYIQTGDNYYENEWLKTASTYWKNQWYVYGLGLSGVVEGVVFDNVVEIDYLPTQLMYNAYVVDWGLQLDPAAISKIGCTNHRNMYGKELWYGRSKAPELIDKFPLLGIGKNDLIIADSSNMDAIYIAQQMGYNMVPAYKPPGSRKTGTDALRAKTLYITKDSKNWYIERAKHKFKEVNGQFIDEPMEGNDHLWDGARYWQQHFYNIKNVRTNPKSKRKISSIR